MTVDILGPPDQPRVSRVLARDRVSGALPRSQPQKKKKSIQLIVCGRSNVPAKHASIRRSWKPYGLFPTIAASSFQPPLYDVFSQMSKTQHVHTSWLLEFADGPSVALEYFSPRSSAEESLANGNRCSTRTCSYIIHSSQAALRHSKRSRCTEYLLVLLSQALHSLAYAADSFSRDLDLSLTCELSGVKVLTSLSKLAWSYHLRTMSVVLDA